MSKARKLVLDGQTFYYAAQESEADKMGAVFLAQIDKHPQHRLSIYFPFYGDQYTGNALLQGLTLVPTEPERSQINLHTPGLAAQLIFYALECSGWQPQHGLMHLDNGGEILRELGYALPTSSSKTQFLAPA